MRFEDKILRKLANEDKPQVVTACIALWQYKSSVRTFLPEMQISNDSGAGLSKKAKKTVALLTFVDASLHRRGATKKAKQ